MNHRGIGLWAAAAVALLPFVTSTHLYSGAVNAKYFFVVTLMSLLMLLAAWRVYKGELEIELRGRKLFWALAAVLAVYYVAAFSGVFPERSLYSDVLRSTGVFFLTHMALAAALFSHMFAERDWTLVRRGVALSGALFGLLSMLGSEGFGLLNSFLWINLGVHGATFANSTFAGAYLVLALVLALIELSRSTRGSRARLVMIMSAALMLLSPALLTFGSVSDPVSFLGSARASSVTAWALLAFLGGWKLLRRWGKARGVWSGAWIVAIATGIALLFTPGSVVQEKYVETSTAARLIVWSSAADAIKERPVLGYGSENFEQAVQKHFDNRLYLDENLGEIWFDRAHNVIIDTLIEVGVLGVVAIALTIACFYAVIMRAKRRGLVGEWEALLLSALPIAHVLQLQTSFDTVGTYALLSLFAGYALWLERKMLDTGTAPAGKALRGRLAAAILAIIALVSLKSLVLDEYGRQISILAILKTTNLAEQEKLVHESLSRTSSFSSLRFSSGSFTKGALEHLAAGGNADIVRSHLSLYEHYYARYLEEAPFHYRARMNYAYLLLLKTALGEEKTKEAKALLAESYALSPGNPLTYALDAVASLYSGRVQEARDIMNKGVALNPDVEFSEEILTYIAEQEREFPNVTILKLDNL